MIKQRKTKDKNSETMFECPRVVFRFPEPSSVVAYLKHCDWTTRPITTAWSHCAQNILCLGSRVNCIDLTGHY